MANSDQIRVTSPTSNEKNKDYKLSDLEAVMRRNNGWHSWDDAINWLKQNGDASNELTPGEVRHMVDDFEKLRNQGKPFTTDAQKIEQEAHK